MIKLNAIKKLPNCRRKPPQIEKEHGGPHGGHQMAKDPNFATTLTVGKLR